MIHPGKIKISAAEEAILGSVVYSSLFDYPLRLEELRQSLLNLKLDGSSILHVFESSPFLKGLIEYREGYLFLKGQAEVIGRRRRREAVSRAVLETNAWVLKLVCTVPYTRLVALSGSAAHLNMDGDGDIDLFIVTRGNRVWSAAVTILLLTRLLGRRKMVCFNFILSDQRLQIDRRDVFTANQIIHLRPVIGRHLYRRFVSVNPFVGELYPNFSEEQNTFDCSPGPVLKFVKILLEWLLRPGPSQAQELICRAAYSRYLKRKSDFWESPEEVVMEKDYLKLHTHSHRKEILTRFEEALKKALRRGGITQSRTEPRP